MTRPAARATAPATVDGLRVAMVTGEYPPMVGGVGDYTAILVEHLRQLGVAVQVVSGLEVGGGRPAASPPTPNQRPPTLWGPRCWPAIARLAADCQLVHIQYQAAAYGLNGAITLLPLWLRLARPAVRVVTTFHDLRVPYLFPKAGPLRQVAVRVMLRGSHAAIFGDPADLQAAGPGPGRRWIPIGSNIAPRQQTPADRAALRQALGVADDQPLIGYFGLVNASKGLETLLQALARLRVSGSAPRLLLIGDAAGASDPTNRLANAELEALLASEGLGQAVQRTGWLPSEAVSAHLQACDVVVLPYRDGASLRRGSLLAALVHGLPIVTTWRGEGGMERGRAGEQGRERERRGAGGWPADEEAYLQDGRQALLVRPDDSVALADAISRLVTDEPLRRRLARGAAELGQRFSWPAIAGAVAEVYASLLTRERWRDGDMER